MAMTPALHAIAQLLALQIVDSLAWGSVIVVFTALLLRVTRQRAGTRFALYFSALMAIGVLPLISGGWWPRAAISQASHPVITLPDHWAVYFLAAWAAIAGWLMLGVGRAVWYVHVLRRDCLAINPDTLDPLLQETLRRHGKSREVAICRSEKMRVPTAIGLLKATIVIPDWVMRELTPAELNQILLHELAHLRRRDDWTNLAQQVMKAIFFFHPAVWWIEKRVSLEREMACDDAVLAETSSPRAYAECLARLAEKSFLQRSVALAQAALGRVRQTSLRVAQILSVNRRSTDTLGWKPAVSLVALCAIACAVWSSRAPRLVAFEENAQSGMNRVAADRSSHDAISGRVSGQVRIVPVVARQAMPTSPAKFNAGASDHDSLLASRRMNRSVPSKLVAGDMVHLTAAGPVGPYTETVFFVVEGSGAASQDVRVYQIQMFRVTIRQQSDVPTVRTPRKT